MVRIVAYRSPVLTADVTKSQIVAAVVSALVLLVPFVALFSLLRARPLRVGSDVAFLAPPLLWVAIWVVALEGLSVAGSVSRTAVRVVAVVLLVLSVATARWWWRGVTVLVSDVRRLMGAVRHVLSTQAWWRLPLLVAVLLTVIAASMSLLVALVGAPNNPDSLAYHLPRAMWWLQEGELGSFVTSDPREVAFPPLNSYLLLISLAAPGNDLLGNLVQWSAAAVSAVMVLLMSRRAGLSRLGVLIAGILVLTIPSGITVATTTKADWLAAVWPLIALATVISRSRNRVTLPWLLVLVGLSAALAGATKATSAVAVGVVVLLGIVWEWRPPSRGARTTPPLIRAKASLLVAASAVAGVLAGFVPQALRTWAVYGNATGPDLDIVVTEPSARIVWGNAVRTVLNNVGVPPPLSDWINPYLPNVLPWIGVPISDDAALYEDASLELLIGRNEDFATNPIHMVLGLGAALVVLVMRRAPTRLRYLCGVALAVFVVSVGTLQWNLWTSRFLLGVMALFAIPLAWLLASGMNRSRESVSTVGVLSIAVVVTVSAYGAVIAVVQEYRPLLGPGSILVEPRVNQYFRINDRVGTEGNMQERVLQQAAALQRLPHGSTIGLSGLGAQEYLVWRFLNPDDRFRFINLEGPEGTLPMKIHEVDSVVCVENCEVLESTR